MSYRELRFRDNEWGDLPVIFTSDEVPSEKYWQIAARVTKNCYSRWRMYYLISYSLVHDPKDTIPLSIVTTADLWRHVNARYWHFDVIFVDCYWKYLFYDEMV